MSVWPTSERPTFFRLHRTKSAVKVTFFIFLVVNSHIELLRSIRKVHAWTEKRAEVG